jgi:cell division protein FtsB
MIEVDPDVVKSGSDAWHQAITIVTQAISSQTTHDKDLLVYKMIPIWQLGQASAEHLAISIDSMRRYLENMRRKECASNNAYEILTLNTSFYEELENLPHRFFLESQIRQIHSIEEEIKTHRPLETPDLLEKYEAAPDPPVIRRIRIRDLVFRRLEELVTALKKRSLIFDDSDDLILHVTENYGNIAGLLAKYHELSAENKELKEEEKRFKDDGISKRRYFTSLTKSQLAKLVFLFERELVMQQSIGKALTKKPEVEPGPLDFDAFCHPESTDIRFSGADFPTMADPDTVSKICETESPAEQLALLRSIVTEHQTTNEKMTELLRTLRSGDRTPSTDITEREERLWHLHEKFSSQIVDVVQQLDTTSAESGKLYEQIIDCLAEAHAWGVSLGCLYHQRSALALSHAFLEALVQHNLAISRHLATLSCSFGQNMLHGGDPAIENYIRAGQADKSSLRDEEESSHAGRMGRAEAQRSGRKRRKPYRPRQLLSSAGGRGNPIEGAAPSQLLDFLALTQELHQPGTGCHAVLSETLRTTLESMLGSASEALNNFHAEMAEGIRMATLGSVEVLRRGKADVEVEAGLTEFCDVEVVMDPPEPAPKGKGKKPVAKK